MDLHSPITLVLADDHPIVLKGLCEVIHEDPELLIVGTADDGRRALALIEEHLPHIAVLDVEMPEMSGLEVVRRVGEQSLPVRLIILTMYDDETIFSRALDLGVRGYILKDSASRDIVRGIKEVAHGEYFISPSLAGKALHNRRTHDPSMDKQIGLHHLTQAERRILQLIAADKSTKEIAETLCISPKTVDNHRSNISAKLHLSGSFSLLRFALENKNLI